MQRLESTLDGARAALNATTQASSWEIALFLALLLLSAFVVDWLTQRILRPVLVRLVRSTPTQLDDALLHRGVVNRISHIAPALVVHFGIELVPNLQDGITLWIGRLASAYIVFVIAQAASAFLSALNDLYEKRPHARHRPIKGYIQLLKIVVYMVALIGIFAILLNRNVMGLLAGLGATGAILMLVFKDTLLSLVASVQIGSNDMVRVGDWIEMPSLGVDGEIIDIALHTVKVQNWDKTIVTVPTHRLIEDSVKNWRGMSDAGGRRIKRSVYLDQHSVRFLATDEAVGLERFAVLTDYLQDKRKELEAWNGALLDRGLNASNARRVTNLGTFRVYLENYLRQHPGIHQDMTLMVRQLPPGATGLPLEIYCFTNDIRWEHYEGIQSDIFDHLLAILPEFGLRVFQDISDAGMNALSDQLRAGRDGTAA